MKKILAAILTIVMVLSLCAFASADTTEARSANITVSVKQYVIEAGNKGGSANKNTAGTTVMTTIGTNRTGWADVKYDFTGAITKSVTGATATVLASELTAGVTKSCTKTVTVTATVTGADKKEYKAGSATLTYYIVWAGEEITDTDPTGGATSGDFTVSLGSSYTAWEGDKIEFATISNVVSADLQAVIESGYTVTYKVYLYDGTKIVGTIENASTTNNVFEVYASYGTTYTAWAVGTLTYTAKAPKAAD